MIDDELQTDYIPLEEVKNYVDTLLTKIGERANVVYEKKTEYSVIVLNHLYEDLTEALKNLKKGR